MVQQQQLAISDIQLTLHKVHTVHTVKSAVSLKWQVGFKNDMKITPILYFQMQIMKPISL